MLLGKSAALYVPLVCRKVTTAFVCRVRHFFKQPRSTLETMVPAAVSLYVLCQGDADGFLLLCDTEGARIHSA